MCKTKFVTITNVKELEDVDLYFTSAKELIGINPSKGFIDKKLLSEEEFQMVKGRIMSRNGELILVNY